MERIKNYIQLHLNIMLFSFTGVFSKMAAMAYNQGNLCSLRRTPTKTYT